MNPNWKDQRLPRREEYYRSKAQYEATRAQIREKRQASNFVPSEFLAQHGLTIDWPFWCEHKALQNRAWSTEWRALKDLSYLDEQLRFVGLEKKQKIFEEFLSWNESREG